MGSERSGFRVHLLLIPVALLLVAGCIGIGDASDIDEGSTEEPLTATQDEATEVEPFLMELDGYVLVGYLDIFMHLHPTETLLYDVQPSGWSFEVDEVPEAIEMRVDWDTDADFRLHPHFVVDHDESPGGSTEYYGYFSPWFDESPGCVRIPAEDMAAGTWQAMIHPSGTAVDTPFTVTVGIVGAQAELLDEIHGHRADGTWTLEDRGWEPCEFLDEPE